ncbi:unnamed protein product [Soboliphyme baturini]|uniref:CYCLIN domain-containing protein n=1 Tax=Soboliphyme baturini TaxID=241478 RepID=A0A183IJZ8_9BILA|nr:unnamed protein product [Soboliphyme baturini]
MPTWFFERKELRNTPSFQDGIDSDKEARYRREGARFICDVGTDLNLRYDTVATGVVYFHRFFMCHSLKDFNRYVSATGCLFLAGKVEETPKKCKDVIRVARLHLTDADFAGFGEDPREEVMTVERILLQTIKFDLQVEHPYQYLLKWKVLSYKCLVLGEKEKIQQMVQMAWTFVNDSLCTTLCLQWEPEIIAIALMYLASRLTKFDICDWQSRKGVKGEKWWDQFVEDLSMELLEGSSHLAAGNLLSVLRLESVILDICHQVLDLYSNSKEKLQQPTVAKVSASTAAGAGPAPTSTTTSKVSSSSSMPDTPNEASHVGSRPASRPPLPITPTTVVPPPPPPQPVAVMAAAPLPPVNPSVLIPPPAVQPSYSFPMLPPPPIPSMPPLPPGVQPIMNMPSTVNVPAGLTLPPNMAVPPNVNMPINVAVPPSMQMPMGMNMQSNVNLPPTVVNMAVPPPLNIPRPPPCMSSVPPSLPPPPPLNFAQPPTSTYGFQPIGPFSPGANRFSVRPNFSVLPPMQGTPNFQMNRPYFGGPPPRSY